MNRHNPSVFVHTLPFPLRWGGAQRPRNNGWLVDCTVFILGIVSGVDRARFKIAARSPASISHFSKP